MVSTSLIKIKLGNCCPETAGIGRRIIITQNKRCALEDLPHHLTLRPDPFAVNNPDKLESSGVSFKKILFDYGLRLFWRDTVQIEYVADLEPNRFLKWVFEVIHLILLRIDYCSHKEDRTRLLIADRHQEGTIGNERKSLLRRSHRSVADPD